MRSTPAIAAITLLTGIAWAQSRAPEEASASADEIVVSVSPYRDIVVNGRARRCRPAAADPLDSLRIGGAPDDYMMIVPDAGGDFAVKRVTEQITGPDFWQRVGVGMGAYHFRSLEPGKPMCVGGRGTATSFAGFRRIVDATSYRGHRVRFTAWVATRQASQVNFWLAVGSNRFVEAGDLLKQDRLLHGGNTNHMPLRGNHGWTPVLLETGPLQDEAGHISYGFNLARSGDVWVYDAKLEVVAAGSEGAPLDDLIMIGRDED